MNTDLSLGDSVTVDNNDNVLVNGFFQGTVDFGGGNLIGANPMFLLKLLR